MILKHCRVSGMDIIVAIGMMVGGAVVNALAFTGSNYLFSVLGDKSAEAEKERKRHDLAIQELERAHVKYTNASCVLTTSTNSFRMSNIVHRFLANVNSRSRSLYAVARPSVVCRLSVCLSVGNARAPYSGGSNFRQYFYGIWYPSHPLTSTENFTEIVPGEPLRRGS